MRRSLRCAATPAQAQALWEATEGWPRWVDGCARVLTRDGTWPSAGARLTWQSTPDGRGHVTELVTERVTGGGHAVEVQDAALSGVQRVRFAPVGDGAELEVTLELDYRLRHRRPGMALIDRLFIRRAVGDSLSRTLAAFAGELGAREAPGTLR